MASASIRCARLYFEPAATSFRPSLLSVIKPLGWESAQAYQVRVLDAGKYEATQRLQQDCAALTSKIDQLNGLVRTYLEVLDKQASQMIIPPA